MTQVIATMNELDLRRAEHAAVHGRHVWKLQAMLNVWLVSSDEAPPPLLDTDGAGGVLTRAVLLDFQAAHSLAADAIVGPLTWRALLEFDLLKAD